MHTLLKKTLATSALSLLAMSASAMTTWDFTSGGSASTSVGSSYGNTITFTESGEDVTVSAWADTGPPPPSEGTLETAWVGQMSGGLGVCNQDEGPLSFCQQTFFTDQVDNLFQQDLVVFQFDNTYNLDSVTIDPLGIWDRDVSVWVGDAANPLDLTGTAIADLDTLGFDSMMNFFNGVGSGPITIDLTGLSGNTLVLGALYPKNGLSDRFMIESLSATVVPIPAAAWLFASGLGMLVWRRKRS